MSGDVPSGAHGTWTHHAALYDDDAGFLEMALPFVTGGLAAGDPVLAVTTPANLDLLREHLGADADRIDYADSVYFGRRPPQRVAAFERYWRRHAGRCAPGSGRRVRVLAEPIWSGRSAREVAAWKRMEAGLNVVLAGTRMWMVCPYDTRVTAGHIADDALRTHPGHAVGARYEPSPDFTDPHAFARALDEETVPSAPPDDAARVDGAGLSGLRAFARARAQACGLGADAAAVLVAAVNEAATYLGAPPATAVIWPAGGAIVCEVRTPSTRPPEEGPFAGFRTPDLGHPRPSDGLWYTRQVTTHVDLRTTRDGPAARIHFPGPRAVEHA